MRHYFKIFLYIILVLLIVFMIGFMATGTFVGGFAAILCLVGVASFAIPISYFVIHKIPQ